MVGRLTAGIAVVVACAIAVWCFEHGLFDPNTRAGSRALVVFGFAMAFWGTLFVVAIAFWNKQSQSSFVRRFVAVFGSLAAFWIVLFAAVFAFWDKQ